MTIKDYNHDLSNLKGLYDSKFESDNCGLGLIAKLDNMPTRDVLDIAVQSLCSLTHRGGLATDLQTGDGCGLLVATPDAYFKEISQNKFETPLNKISAVGMVFLNQNEELSSTSKKVLNNELEKHGLQLVGWRNVPVNRQVLGDQARYSEPCIQQIFVNCPDDMTEDEFNRFLFISRRFTEMKVSKENPNDTCFYIASLHSRTIIYKGLMLPNDLTRFYLDLSNKKFISTMCSYHQRFSTNTLPEWRLAQPFRYLAHNGELNTIQGNRNWARSRAKHLNNKILPELTQIDPIVSQTGSDSGTLDNMLEVLHMGGLSLIKAMRILIPPAWQNNKTMSSKIKAFFDYYSHFMEPWDGPAGIMLHDGRFAVCSLDRNGLRPSRYVITKDGFISFSSEVGVFNYDNDNILKKGRLHPGELISVDLQSGEISYSETILDKLTQEKDYEKWLANSKTILTKNESIDLEYDAEKVHNMQKYFDISFEERDQILRVLAEEGQEATGSMGDDVPLPVFSKKTRSLYDFFRQMFAQVTNPPIDSLRETLVMSLKTIIGSEPNVFSSPQPKTKRLEFDSPVLLPPQIKQLKNQSIFRIEKVSLHYSQEKSLEQAVNDLCLACESLAKKGVDIIHLSDKDISPEQLTIHSLMAVGAVHHQLINSSYRSHVNLLVETATARDAHHMATLLGYGATLIYPYLSYLSLKEMMITKELPDNLSLTNYCLNYHKGINKALLKIFSKIGISTVNSYRAAQLFEIIGLSTKVVQKCFKGTTSRIEGLSFEQLQVDQQILAKIAFNPRKTIQQGGLLKFVHGGEEHAYSPSIVDLLRTALQKGDQNFYNSFAKLVNNRKPITLRDYLQIKHINKSIPIEQVEAKEELFKRFDCAGISMGALSPEAHEAIAIAMNHLGSRSNSGEGGEDITRFNTEKNSKIKQIASGRFGVTAQYLMSAEVVQIKIAQGAKPGEGGQLPGHKVDAYIGKLRYSTPGVTLISPPPHHDIYSIEDLAQLIFDLKQIKPELLVSVKLVSAPGVGTVAAGVAKAYADLITISGYDGGTGASPLSSVKYAGCPFELGLSEARQVLRANNLRGQVRLQTDGGLKTGLDVVKAAILGAESFGFGTAPMIALGCKYLRICHLNICPVGVATQLPKLRNEHFNGMPQMVINYFEFIAEETRQIMAKLGVKSLKEIIGRTEFLEQIDTKNTKQSGIDLTPVISNEGISEDKPHFCNQARNNPWDKGEKNIEILEEIQTAINNKTGGVFNFSIKNTDRSVGARASGLIAQKYGNHGMEDKPIIIHLNGVAGQSFGVWNAGGLHLYLKGDANDYVGKGMSGGKIVISPPNQSTYNYSETPIVGNTCLYGATNGKFFADGLAGERFAVRNSGAIAVVTGMGDHGCEYMTGGIIMSLGEVGVNFGAGMSGGCAFLYDKNNQIEKSMNEELIESHCLSQTGYDQQIGLCYQLLEEFTNHTKSSHGQYLLKNFENEVKHFKFIKSKQMCINTLMQNIA